MKSPQLELKEVSLAFTIDSSIGSAADLILDRINLVVEKGEFVSIIGPSGSGKTTLFHLIGGLLEPSSGEIWMEGQSIAGSRGRISYMPQQPALLPWRTVVENAAIALEIAGVSRKAAAAQANEWLIQAGLSGYEQEYPYVLSGGMQQRVAFVRAILAPQELLCLDEPFASLDALTRVDMQHWLLHLWEKHRRTVLLVTHSIDEALLLSDRIYVLSSKPARIIQEFIVPFSRPRHEELTTSESFTQLKKQIYQLLMTKVTSL